MKKKLADLYRKMSPREKKILYGVAAVMAILFADRMVAGPVLHRVTALDRQIRDEEASIKQGLHVLLQKNKILAESKAFAAYSVEGRSPEAEMTSLLKELETLADRASVSLMYVKPANTEELSGVKKYHASLECEAEMSAVGNFFHSIEGSTSLLKVEKYDIQPKSKESSIARCTVSVSKTVLG